MANCAFPLCKSHAEKNGYCVRHRIYAADQAGKKSNSSRDKPAGDVKKKHRIPRKTKKLASRERQYKKIVTELLATDPWCELRVPDVCTGKAEGLHHMKGRGIHLLTRKYLKRSCNACNGYVERHPQYALDNGLSVSRLAKE